MLFSILLLIPWNFVSYVYCNPGTTIYYWFTSPHLSYFTLYLEFGVYGFHDGPFSYSPLALFFCFQILNERALIHLKPVKMIKQGGLVVDAEHHQLFPKPNHKFFCLNLTKRGQTLQDKMRGVWAFAGQPELNRRLSVLAGNAILNELGIRRVGHTGVYLVGILMTTLSKCKGFWTVQFGPNPSVETYEVYTTKNETSLQCTFGNAEPQPFAQREFGYQQLGAL